MKNIGLILFVVMLLFACNNASTSGESITSISTKANNFGSDFSAQINEARRGKDLYLLQGEIIEADKLKEFKGLKYFEPDSHFVFNAKIEFLKSEKVVFKTATDREPIYYKFCKLIFNYKSTIHELIAYSDKPDNVTDLFIPFKDSTNNSLTYGGGRYLELKYRNEKSNFLLDFNFAFNPYCHYNHSYSCPIVPIDNYLKMSILAGEKKLYD
jgi:uncharacterized protein